ncbi:MAG TPA: magnesium transporter, partial [Tepidisphaeraceae bacterium]
MDSADGEQKVDGAREHDEEIAAEEAPPPSRPETSIDLDAPGMAKAEGVAERIEDLPAPDGAAVMERMTPAMSADVAEALDPETAGQILSEMDATLAASVIADMEVPEASMVLEAMDPDDRVDILEHVPQPLHDQLINEMAALEAAEVRSLEQYPPDTAGGIMTTDVTALDENLTVEQAIEELRRLSEELEQMFYVYVVDRRKHLVGVLSMRDLILARPGRKLNEIMIPNVSALPAPMDQEEVARLFDKYGYMAMPVVDAKNRLIGIVTVDDVVDVLQEEATEDVQKMFGAGAEERLNSRWQFSFKMRVWWLIVNLATAFLAGAVVGAFEDTLHSLTLLAIYMPIVAGMGGNAGAQAMAVSIRGLALGKVDRKLLWHVMWRELIVGVAMGIVVGLITAAVALLWHHNAGLGLVVGLALIVNHTLACTSGAAIPFIMKKLGFDPAQSSTIFATTFTDCGGFFVCLGLAKI